MHINWFGGIFTIYCQVKKETGGKNTDDAYDLGGDYGGLEKYKKGYMRGCNTDYLREERGKS